MQLNPALRKVQPQYEQSHEKVIPQHFSTRPHIAKHVRNDI